MSRGIGWSDSKFLDVSRAWIYFSEDPIVGIYQTAVWLLSTMFQKFNTLAPTDFLVKNYGGRSDRSRKYKIDEVFAD